MVRAIPLTYFLFYNERHMDFLLDLNHPAVLFATAVLMAAGGLAYGIAAAIGRRGKMARLMRELTEARVQLKEADRAKADFLSIVSHQLRSPLTVIKVGAGALLNGTFGVVRAKRQREALGKILESTERLVRLTSDYLDVSRVELGNVEYHLASTDIGKLIREVVVEYADRAKGKGLMLSLAGEKSVGRVLCDGSKIREAMANLLDNAIKYTSKGSITVRCEVLAPGDNRLPEPVRARGGAMVSVQDTGMGFDPSEAEVLFQRFRRARQKGLRRRGSEPVEGSGLGLSIAKMFVEAHGGALLAASSGRGRGSLFVLSLPA